ncbi:MAG: hypothetical protein V8Q70_08705 [Bacteroides eggerthii]
MISGWTFLLVLFIGTTLFIGGLIMWRQIDEEEKKGGNSGCLPMLTAFILTFGGCGGTCYTSYKFLTFDYIESIEEALEEYDFEKAHELLFDMSHVDVETNDFWGKSRYSIAFEKVIKAEISYLINQNTREASDRLIALIGNLPIEANPTIGITTESDTQEQNEEYVIYVGKINGLCDDILFNAISSNNKHLAEKILMMYKPTLTRTLVESKIISSNVYRYDYSNEAMIAAQKRFDEAVKKGAFQ